MDRSDGFATQCRRWMEASELDPRLEREIWRRIAGAMGFRQTPEPRRSGPGESADARNGGERP